MSRKRQRSETSGSSRDGRSASCSTTASQERSKHYPMFEDNYLDQDDDNNRVDTRVESPLSASDTLENQPFLTKCHRTGRYLLFRRFAFVKQLGKGTYAKVALAEDGLATSSACRVVALKIFRAERNYDEAFFDELRTLSHLFDPGTIEDPTSASSSSASSQDTAIFDMGAKLSARPLFSIKHRLHCAAVYPVLGMSLLDVLEARRRYFEKGSQKRLRSGGMPMSLVRSITYQLVCVAHFLRCRGVVHTDLKPENILMELPAPLISDEQYGPLPASSAIRVIDFGSAEMVKDFRDRSSNGDAVNCRTIQTRHYRAPEVIFASGWTFSADMWSIGLVMLELWCGECVFMTHEDDEHLAMMQRLIGKPKEGYHRVFGRGKYIDDFVRRRSGELRWPGPDTSTRSLKYLSDVKDLREVCKDAPRSFEEMARWMLEWDPSRRCTPLEALRHPFFS